jgi:hypothetical protein
MSAAVASSGSSAQSIEGGPLRVVHIAYEVQPDGTLRERMAGPPPTPLPPYAGRALSEDCTVEPDVMLKSPSHFHVIY